MNAPTPTTGRIPHVVGVWVNRIGKIQCSALPMSVLSAILTNPTDINHVRFLATPDVTYASINYHNPDLNKIMSCARGNVPWAERHREDVRGRRPVLGNSIVQA